MSNGEKKKKKNPNKKTLWPWGREIETLKEEENIKIETDLREEE